MRAPTTYWETYESQLSDAGRGLPLWNPGPYREVDGTACPVRLGDVGYMFEGRFVTLFNTGENGLSTLRDHERYPSEKLHDAVLTQSRINQFTSKSVDAYVVNLGISSDSPNIQVSATLTCKREYGAALIFPSSNDSDTMHSLNLRHQNHYIDYCFRNCENWLNASDSAAKHIELKDLIFVTGIDNVYAWSMFSFAQQSKNCSFRLTAGTSTVTGALVVQSSSSVEHTPVTNFGPVERHGNCAPASPDQTVFIRRFKLHRRVDWLKWRMKTYVRATQPEGEKYARSPVTRECTTMAGDSSAQNFFISSDGSGSGDDSECDPMDAETLEPLDALLDYILETCPNAHYSCAGDDDLSPFREHLSDWLSFPSLLRRIRPEVYLTANGFASLRVLKKPNLAVVHKSTQLGLPTISFGASVAEHAQHRSRVTVVCAECKRLKLKCDRRTPCSACVKRDMTDRCTYSPAAKEKIDVMSLHNRLEYQAKEIQDLSNQLRSIQLQLSTLPSQLNHGKSAEVTRETPPALRPNLMHFDDDAVSETTTVEDRSHVTVECSECRKLELKCDLSYPCSSCTNRGVPEVCIYSYHEQDIQTQSSENKWRGIQMRNRGGVTQGPKVEFDSVQSEHSKIFQNANLEATKASLHEQKLAPTPENANGQLFSFRIDGAVARSPRTPSYAPDNDIVMDTSSSGDPSTSSYAVSSFFDQTFD